MMSGPVERVATLLASGGYLQLSSPIAVAGVPFEFDAVLVGTERAHDLVIVIDTVLASDRRLSQQVEALGRALDVAGSLRPLSVVTVGPPPRPEVLDVMSRIARVLVVHPHGSGDDLIDALAVLLPLNVPTPSSEAHEGLSNVAAWAASSSDPAGVLSLIPSSKFDADAVSKALAKYLSSPFASIPEEES